MSVGKGHPDRLTRALGGSEGSERGGMFHPSSEGPSVVFRPGRKHMSCGCRSRIPCIGENGGGSARPERFRYNLPFIIKSFGGAFPPRSTDDHAYLRISMRVMRARARGAAKVLGRATGRLPGLP